MAEESQDDEDQGAMEYSEGQIERTLRLLWSNRQPVRYQAIRTGSEEAAI